MGGRKRPLKLLIMIQQAVVISMIILAIHSFTWQGMIFNGIKKLIKPEWHISKPIYGCPICMTPWWGTLMYAVFFWSGSFYQWIDWLCVVGCATGFSVISVILITLREHCLDNDSHE